MRQTDRSFRPAENRININGVIAVVIDMFRYKGASLHGAPAYCRR